MLLTRHLRNHVNFGSRTLLRPFTELVKPDYSIESVAYPRRQKKLADLALETINVEESIRDAGVFHLTLNRPTRGNAFNMQMWHEFQDAFKAVEGDKSARVVVLTGSSTSFSTGMDLSVFAEMQKMAMSEPCEGRRREALINFVQFLQDAISAPEKCSVPVIAAVSGYCIGGAVDLITACDLRYCTDNSMFCIKETDLAMVADIGTLQRLPSIIGDQQTRELAYTGRTILGKEAESLGLVLKSFATEELMDDHVQKTSAAIAAKSPLTIRYKSFCIKSVNRIAGQQLVDQNDHNEKPTLMFYSFFMFFFKGDKENPVVQSGPQHHRIAGSSQDVECCSSI